jgi:hypothetical protein
MKLVVHVRMKRRMPCDLSLLTLCTLQIRAQYACMSCLWESSGYQVAVHDSKQRWISDIMCLVTSYLNSRVVMSCLNWIWCLATDVWGEAYRGGDLEPGVLGKT